MVREAPKKTRPTAKKVRDSSPKVHVGNGVYASASSLRTVSGAARAITKAHEKAFRELGDS
jgi:hypothetical protein